MHPQPARGKPGRPLKFGRRGTVVAITLPEDVVRGLRQMHPDLGWAIVTLFEKTPKPRRSRKPPRGDAELVTVGGRRSLIVVNGDAIARLPGVSVIPLHDDRAFLALEPGRGMPDLELAVIDRLARPSVAGAERRALGQLRRCLRDWRGDRTLRCETRAIIVIERLAHRRTQNGGRDPGS